MMASEIRISLSAFDKSMVEHAISLIFNVVESFADRPVFEFRNVVALPVKKTKITVNRSVHVDKKSREHFEFRVHRRLILLKLADDSSGVVSELTKKIDMPFGVQISKISVATK